MNQQADVREALRRMFAGRPVVITGGPVAGLARSVPEVTELSGRTPFLLANGVGTGAVLEPAAAEVHVLADGAPASMVRAVHAQLDVLADLPADALAALDAWDPERAAVVLASPFFTGTEIAGRPVVGGRRPAWAALEDKTISDALWDDVGVPRAPSRIVGSTYDALTAAARELDLGEGTVWSGDAREGFNGGGEYVRWVRDDRQARDATDFFAAHCDQVRVMPFLDGVPCSIHGVCFPDGVAALRPVEMVTLRSVENQFVYGGISTHWDPADADREAMRDAARRVARRLVEQVGYLGGFSIDGVLTADGFLPTELNPRFSGGLNAIAKGLPDFPCHLMLDAVVSGYDTGLSAERFESMLIKAADAHRWGGGGLSIPTLAPTETDEREIILSGDDVRLARVDEQPHGALMLGPSAVGAYLRFEPHADRVLPGRSIAPMVASAFALADRTWGTGIGALQAARDVRPATGGGVAARR
jgi:ATP-grasp domain